MSETVMSYNAAVKTNKSGHGKLYDVIVSRSFAVLIVLLFHCYGMMYADAHFPETVSMYKDLYYNFNQCFLINLAMPLFVFISGYLFRYLIQIGKYPTWGNLLHKKGLRILLPYFVFGLFFMATTGNWHPLQLLQHYWHLWFLPMLFWCFVVGYGLSRIKLRPYMEIALLIVTFLGLIIPEFLPRWFGLNSLTTWFYWFYFGGLVCKYKGILFNYIAKYKLCIPLLFVYGIVTYMFPVGYVAKEWYSGLAVTICLLSVTYLINKVDWEHLKVTPMIERLSDCSFGIYIWHYWVALMLFSSTSKQLLGLSELASNHVLLFPLCFSLITLLVSLFLSWSMMKTRIGKFLIG